MALWEILRRGRSEKRDVFPINLELARTFNECLRFFLSPAPSPRFGVISSGNVFGKGFILIERPTCYLFNDLSRYCEARLLPIVFYVQSFWPATFFGKSWKKRRV